MSRRSRGGIVGLDRAAADAFKLPSRDVRGFRGWLDQESKHAGGSFGIPEFAIVHEVQVVHVVK